MSTSETEAITDANGLTWVNGGAETDDHLAFGGHEPKLLEIAKNFIPEGGVFLDVGAHVGLWTLNMALRADYVWAVEANPKTYATLLENVKNNGELVGEVRTVNVAAWDVSETLRMEDENDKETGGSTRTRPDKKSQVNRYSEGSNLTQGVVLDTILYGQCDPDLIKIDVEGAEAHVLRGLEKTILMNKPVLFIEMHDVVYDDYTIRAEVLQFLEKVDYHYDDSLTFGAAYYIIAKSNVVQEPDWAPEIVKAGEFE